ncbi:unnamed protein product [Timema podura]|uniref:Fibronectin type-III domain-containing protein n=1 Tax=Timema podura TaxID=61482 RepID=A0ABN7P720_TIMPD|nr:unnamed protein product [Timema podura]
MSILVLGSTLVAIEMCVFERCEPTPQTALPPVTAEKSRCEPTPQTALPPVTAEKSRFRCSLNPTTYCCYMPRLTASTYPGLHRPMSALSGRVQPCYLAYSLNIAWSPSPNVSVVRREIQWCEMGSGQWQNLPLQDATGEVNYFMRNLRPKTQYTFRLTMEYAPFQELYVWPVDGRFTYETLGDRPSPPGVPKVQQLGRDTYQVWWEPSQENGAAIDSYSLEGMEEGGERRDAGNHSAQQLGWDIYYNGSENYWNLSKLSPSLKYTFRARARNRHGWSDYGGSSRVFDLTAASMLADSGDLNPILYMVLPVGVSVCVLVVCALLYVSLGPARSRRDSVGARDSSLELPLVESHLCPT